MENKKQPIYFESIQTGVKFHYSKNQKSFDGLYRYTINKNSSKTYDIGYFKEQPERFKPSKNLVY